MQEARIRLEEDRDLTAASPDAAKCAEALRLWSDDWQIKVEAALAGDSASLAAFRRPVDTSQMHYVESPAYVLRVKLQRLSPYLTLGETSAERTKADPTLDLDKPIRAPELPPEPPVWVAAPIPLSPIGEAAQANLSELLGMPAPEKENVPRGPMTPTAMLHALRDHRGDDARNFKVELDEAIEDGKAIADRLRALDLPLDQPQPFTTERAEAADDARVWCLMADELKAYWIGQVVPSPGGSGGIFGILSGMGIRGQTTWEEFQERTPVPSPQWRRDWVRRVEFRLEDLRPRQKQW